MLLDHGCQSLYSNYTFIRHDGSLQDTANELIVHRNTVNYKINKASEILKMDLTRLENRLQVMLGFGICQILHK